MTGSRAEGVSPTGPAFGWLRRPRRQRKDPGSAVRAPYDLLAIGPHPPFIVGQSVATAAVLERLQRGGARIQAVDTAPRNLGRKWAQRLSRFPRYAQALLVLAAGHKAPWVYISVDGGIGVYFNVLCAALARLRGSRVVAHHHNYSYIAQPARRMTLFCNAAGPDAVHITLCEFMSRELRQRYGDAIRHTREVSNTCTLGANSGPKTAPPAHFTLGHLSNLCVDKGLPTVINCFRLLRQAGVDAKLRLAGPAADREAAAMVRAAIAEFADSLVYEGPLYGSVKADFYDGISVFLLPTRNEAQALVVLEALASGTPVVAYGRCCIPHDLGETGGLVVPAGASFEEVTLPRLLDWANDPPALARASSLARCRFEVLLQRGEDDLRGLFALVKVSA